MKRFCSQLVFCSPTNILKQTVMEQNPEGVIQAIFSLNQLCSETSHTLFVDGIISNEIISLKQHLSPSELNEIKNNYNYIDLSSSTQINIKNNDKPLLLDFDTSSTADINNILKGSHLALRSFSGIDIIAASTFYPLSILQKDAKLETGNRCNLHIWKGINLVTKEITDALRVGKLSSGY